MGKFFSVSARFIISVILLLQLFLPVQSQVNYNKIKHYKVNDRSKLYLLRKKKVNIDKPADISGPKADIISSSGVYKVENTEPETNTGSTPSENTLRIYNWKFQPDQGDYYDTVKTALLSSGATDTSLKEYRMRSYPVKYWVSASNAARNMFIKNIMHDISFYLPSTEAKSREEANLVIEAPLDNAPNMKCPTVNSDAFGCGGIEIKNGQTYGFAIVLPVAFSGDNPRQYILHEIGHAIGLYGHSDKPTDIMYSQLRDLPTETNAKEDKNTSYSARDLNTLYRIYSQ